MADKQMFETVLEKHAAMDATGITIPFNVEKIFGAKRVPVKITINGATHLSTIIRMGGKYVVGVPKVFRQAANVKAGELIAVTLEKDTEKRQVEIPKVLAEAIAKADVSNVWEKLSYTCRKEFANAVTEAKREETRTKRVEKTIEQLISKRK